MRLTLNNENPEQESTPAIQTEKVTFHDLTFRKKLSYIWDYYKWWMIIFIFTVIIIANAVPRIIENNKEVVLYSVFINTQIDEQESSSFMKDYVAYADIDMKNKRITLDTSMNINRYKVDKLSMESNQKLLALLSSKKVDVIVCDKENFDFYASQGCFKKLDEVLPDEIYQKYKQYFIEASPRDTDSGLYGVNLKESNVLKNEEAYIVEPILGICVNSQQVENSVKFLDYLLSE